MVWGSISQKLTPWRKQVWPHGDLDRWASPALAAGFGLILLWLRGLKSGENRLAEQLLVAADHSGRGDRINAF